MNEWHDHGISIAIDMGVISMLIALMLSLSTATTQGQFQAFGVGLVAFFYGVSIIQEINDMISGG